MGTDIVTYQLQQRDHLLRVARAMSARLEPREVLGVVVRSAVGMTGGRAGAIAIREDLAGGLFEGERAARLERGADPPLRIVASYQLEERYVDYLTEAELARPPSTRPAPAPGPTARSAATSASTTGGTLARWSAEHALGQVVGDSENPRRVLTLPLELRGETIGQIVVLREVTATIFSPLDEDLLRAFADQAAVAIQNALLHARVRRNERQLAAVVQDSAAGIILLDELGRAMAINPAAETLLGLGNAAGPAGIGAPIDELVALEDEAGRPVDIRLPTAADGTLTPRGRLADGVLASGGERWVQVSITPQVADGSRVEGHVVTIADLTAWREAEQAKSAFLAGLSHELKTPLSLIRGFAETLADPAVDHAADFEAQAYRVILDETARLTESVDRLLMASRLQAGALKFQLDVVDVGDLLARLVKDLRLAMPGRELALEVPVELPTITADPERVREVFAELLRNADKYAPPNTPIRIVVTPEHGAPVDQAGGQRGGEWKGRAEGDAEAVAVAGAGAGAGAGTGAGAETGAEVKAGVRVSVIDAGAPIDARERERIFERFYRGDERGDGTGLGLYMARSIARAHGGDVVVGNTGDHFGGNRFDVLLPTAPRSAAR